MLDSNEGLSISVTCSNIRCVINIGCLRSTHCLAVRGIIRHLQIKSIVAFRGRVFLPWLVTFFCLTWSTYAFEARFICSFTIKRQSSWISFKAAIAIENWSLSSGSGNSLSALDEPSPIISGACRDTYERDVWLMNDGCHNLLKIPQSILSATLVSQQKEPCSSHPDSPKAMCIVV